MPGLGTAAVRAFGRFMADDGRRCASAPSRTCRSATCSRRCSTRRGYLDALEAERTIEAQGRDENLEELVDVAREFDATAEAEEATLDDFLQEIALVADADTRTDDEGLVTLMTLHNAKGLEYPIVFIVGMEEGVFPHSRSLEEGSLEEERRLALRRHHARDASLYLTSARRRAVFGATQYGLRSRFLDEIPRELTDRPSEAARRRGGGGFGSARARSGPGRGRRSARRARPRRRSTSASATTSCTRRSATAS